MNAVDARPASRDADESLPASYLAAVDAERARVAHDVLATRGLARRTVLLVGGAGYIGSVLTEHLLRHGYRVRCLDRLLYENDLVVLPWLGHPDYRFDHGDLADARAAGAALEDATDVVILGALVGDPITKKYPGPSRAINLDGTLALLDRIRGAGVNRVVFVSTCSNYGMIPDGAVADEDHPLNPLSIYAETKVAVEKALLASKGRTDFGATVLRFATAFGLSPRMRFDLTVSQFVREAWLGRDLVVYDADTWRPYCHVRDFAEAIRRAIEAPRAAVDFAVFNAGGDANNATKRQIVEMVREAVPNANIRYQEHGSDPRNYRVSFARIRERLCFEPRHSIRDGIAELVAALDRRLFDLVDRRPNFHHNIEIAYP